MRVRKYIYGFKVGSYTEIPALKTPEDTKTCLYATYKKDANHEGYVPVAAFLRGRSTAFHLLVIYLGFKFADKRARLLGVVITR